MANAAESMKEYLKRYQSGAEAEDPSKKKKKKRKKEEKKVMGGVLIVDEDPVWQKPVQIEEPEESESDGEEQPVIQEDIEVRRMKRLEFLRSKHNQISEDGSGWISVPASESNASSRRNPDDDGDLSPPRQRRKRADTPSPDRASRRNDDVNDDLSPPRRRTRHDSVETGDLSPPRRKSKIDADVSDDLSPPRRRKSRFDADVSDDLSPPRRGKSRSDADVSVDLSPPRRKTRHDSVETSDLSPPRRRKSDDASADMSPPRRRKSRFDADVSDDLSPPRRKTRHDSVEKSDLSPPRRRKSDDVSDDMSPPRARKSRSDADVSDDLSPPRRRKSPAERVKQKGKEVGRRSGFFTKEEIEEEIKKKKDQERARMLLMDASVSGEGAEVIFRDKRGEKISREDMLKAKEKEKPKEEKPIAWGKGLAQKREAEARFLEIEKERNKPFARSRDDPELEKMLKETIRWGDPMAHLAKKKNMEPILEDLGDDERMKESGFIIPQTIPNHSWLKRGIDYPSNRYGIKPGRHWDGVDRSNGFEKELFKKKNEKRAMEQEAYLWSVSDM